MKLWKALDILTKNRDNYTGITRNEGNCILVVSEENTLWRHEPSSGYKYTYVFVPTVVQLLATDWEMVL